MENTSSLNLTIPESKGLTDANRELFELIKAANLQMDEKLFDAIVELLRDGFNPDILISFLTKSYSNTKTWKKYQQLLKSKQSESKLKAGDR